LQFMQSSVTRSAVAVNRVDLHLDCAAHNSAVWGRGAPLSGVKTVKMFEQAATFAIAVAAQMLAIGVILSH